MPPVFWWSKARFPELLLGIVLALALPARADDLQDITKLMRQGQHAQALERVNQYLASKPRDAQGRFLKGLIFTEQNKVADAIDVFTKLSQDFPELPEPYNNLAVLYASQGQYEKARQALEMSIRTHPSYATAYENLGDVYTKLASQAYDKALQLDSANTTAQGKLSLIRELISGGNRPPRPASQASPPVKLAEAPKPAAVAPAPKPQAPAPEQKPQAPIESKGGAKPAEAAPKSGNSEDLLKTVRGWANAWASKDVDAYLAYYAKEFKTPAGESRTDWEKGRKQRISAPKKIEVAIETPRVTAVNENSATVTFRQIYRSDHLKVSSTKTLALIRSNGKWLIQQERVGN